MKTCIYLRVSTGEQSSSLEQQEADCRKYCELHGYEVVKVLKDKGVSGKTKVFERHAGKLIKSGLENKRFEHVVVMKLDRLSRSMVDGVLTITEITEMGGSLSVLDFSLDTSTPTGRLFVSQLLAFAQFEREMIAQRVKDSLQHRKDNLKVYNKNTPYGFRREGDDLIPVPEEMEIVKEIRTSSLSVRKLADKFSLHPSKVYRVKKNSIYNKCVG